jgi:hypothetical protein
VKKVSIDVHSKARKMEKLALLEKATRSNAPRRGLSKG